jgi:hypothetical protein
MSSSGILSPYPNPKIFDELLPNPYPYPAQPPSLAQVLTAGDDAGNGNIENLDILQTTNVVQQDTLGQQFLIIGGTILTPGSGGDLRIQGATDKGSILVGNGTSTTGFPVGANGLVLKANSAQPLGVEWASGGGGGVASITAGANIGVDNTIPTAPVVSLLSPLTTDLFLGSVNMTAGDPTTQTHLISNNGGASYTSANNVGGQILATYTATQMSISDPSIQKNIIITPPTGIFLNDQSGATILDTTITEAQVQIKSQTAGSLTQATLTNQALQYVNTDNTITPTITDTSTYDNCSRTAVALDNTTGATATRTEIIDDALQSKQQQTLVSSTQSSTINLNCEYQVGDATTYLQLLTDDITNSINTAGGMTASKTQGEMSVLYANNTIGSQYQGTGNIICNGGASTMTLTSSNIAGASSQLLRMECPLVGDALIEHSVVGATRNLDITTPGQFSVACGSNFLISSAGTSSIATNPSLILQASSVLTTSYPVIKMDRPNATSLAGDVIGAISTWADDAGGTSREWSRIQTVSTNVSTSPANQDGTISIFGSVNGTMAEVFNFNGSQNENNSFKPLDMNNNEIRSNTGNLTLSASASAGTGNVVLTSKATGNVALDSPVIALTTTSVSSTPIGNTVAIETTSALSNITTFWKLKLNGNDIWVPYLTFDPTV